MLGFRKPRDVGAGVLESDELAAARQRYRIFELPFPAAISQNRSVAACPNTAVFDHPIIARRKVTLRSAGLQASTLFNPHAAHFDHGDGAHHRDNNMRAAVIHVLTDAS